jgi:membrane-associated protease RseP (regulator of RpoE activity)
LGQAQASVVISGDSVELGRVQDSVIICDGDFKATEVIRSLIVARGTVRVTNRAQNALIVSWSDVSCPQGAVYCRIITQGTVTLPRKVDDSLNTKVIERDPSYLKLVTWFDLESVGISIDEVDGGFRVKSAREGSPFALSGLKENDVIVLVEDKALKSFESFRRLVRTKAVLEEELSLVIRRDSKLIPKVISFGK